MKIRITYRTRYSYSKTVSLSNHRFRLIPRSDSKVGVRQFSFRTNENGSERYRRDLFDNEVISVFYPGTTNQLDAFLDMELELAEKNPFDFLLENHALHFPFTYRDDERQALAIYLEQQSPPGVLKLPFWEPPTGEAITSSVLPDLNRAIHENIAYTRREEGPARPSSETLAEGSGACRDYAVLLADVLRGYGIAARLASGYLLELGDDDRRAENAMHAWTEAYLPGAGWLGFDPTNGTLCDHHHLTAAVGLQPPDITPVLGTFYHKQASEVVAEMDSKLEVALMDESVQ